MMRTSSLPELLAPAGSPEALRAAVSAGADAVYFGARQFNARKFASNFTEDELADAIRYCHTYGAKTHIVLNTQLYSRELSDALKTAETLIGLGADAFIVADLGLAMLLHRYFPEVSIHASTQACGQNVRSAEMLAGLGFSRMVAARELPLRDIRTLCERSPIETEIFVHGALCVCHSGQCLMSSVIGGRSGNRGECAQPCRLPYRGANPYPLSLKDLCLAKYIPQIIDAGVDSLKIEGRMKTPAYVYGVTSIYRRLLDEKRSATDAEMRELDALFSRSGFTDGYFTEQISRAMLGVRTEENKEKTASAESGMIPPRTIPLHLTARFAAGEPAYLRGEVTRAGETVVREITGARCETPTGAGTPRERIEENLKKVGGTPFTVEHLQLETTPVFLPMSQINAMRRALTDAMTEALAGALPAVTPVSYAPPLRGAVESREKSAFFTRFDAISARACAYFDRIFLPIDEYLAHADVLGKRQNVGVSLPPVCFDHEVEALDASLVRAYEAGCRMALVSGLWQASAAKRAGFAIHGDLRLNLYNAESMAVYESLGFASVIVSPEVGIPAAEAIPSSIPRGCILYGRLPLMTLEKCIIRDTMPKECDRDGCDFCRNRAFLLKDRTGAEFPVLKEAGHRNVLYNSVPTYMADKPPRGLFTHCLFIRESADEVDEILFAIENRLPPQGKFKRL